LLLAYNLFGKRPALYAAVIFCVLPSGSEAVLWISGIGYILQAAYSLLVINLFFLFRSTGSGRFLAASVVGYIIFLVGHPTPWMLTVPFMIVVLDVFSAHPLVRLSDLKTRWYYLVYFVSAGAFWVLWAQSQLAKRVTALTLDFYYNPGEATALVVRLPYTIAKTLELYIFPWRLSFFHEEVVAQSMYTFMVVLTVALLLSIGYLVTKKVKYVGLVLAILASIAPTFSPVQVAWFVAERYLYLGGAFFAMLVALGILRLDYVFTVKHLAGYLLVGLVVCYSARLIIRAADFSSSKALWLATQQTAPTSYRVYNNLGDVYSAEQDWAKAIASFKMSADLAPNYADAIHNLGYTYMLMGDYPNAKKYLLEAYQKNNRLYQALEKLGQLERYDGNTAKAAEYFDAARKLNPASVSQ